MRYLTLISLAAFCSLLMAIPAKAQLSMVPVSSDAVKVALIIGNSNYENVPELANPENDVKAVANSLELQGFNVIRGVDLKRTGLVRALRDFRRMADTADYAMVYYAGHGIEIDGINYLIPTDAELLDARDADVELVAVETILAQLSGTRRLKMVVLDACRNNPFISSMKTKSAQRSIGRGLQIVKNNLPDTLIAYAAAAGEIAPDGVAGGNSPFTGAFVKALSGPPTDVRLLLGRVKDVMRQSGSTSEPYVYYSLGGEELVINPRSPGETTSASLQPNQNFRSDTQSASRMMLDYVTADGIGSTVVWQEFLDRYQSQSNELIYIAAQSKLKKLVAAGENVGPQIDPQDRTVSKQESETNYSSLDDKSLIRSLQTELKARKCYFGGIDGIIGKGSQRGLSTLSRQTGEEMSLRSWSTREEIVSVLMKVEAHPGISCPVVARATTSKKKPSSKVKKNAPTPAAEKSPAVEKEKVCIDFNGQTHCY